MAHHDCANTDPNDLTDGAARRAMFAEFIRSGLQELIDAELAAALGAGRYERTDTRTNYRNGTRPKTVATASGDVEVAIPKLRAGSFFPSLLESGISKSEVSRICAQLDVEIAAFRERTLTHTTFPYVFLDATYCKVRVGAHVISQALVVAIGVSADGTREVLGTAAGDSESFDFWREFLLSLRGRGLSGVHLVISDAHSGLKAAVAQQFTGASWQRCRVHFMRNLQSAVSTKHVPPVMAAIKTVFAHTESEAVAEQWDTVADTMVDHFPKIAEMMRRAKSDVLAFTAFPQAHWQKIWSNNPIERLNKEIKRRADVVEIFPNQQSFLRLSTAVVMEQHDEWQVTRRYVSDVSMAELRKVIRAKEVAAATADALTDQREIA